MYVYVYVSVCCVRAFIYACVCEIYSPNYGFMHVYSKDLKNKKNRNHSLFSDAAGKADSVTMF